MTKKTKINKINLKLFNFNIYDVLINEIKFFQIN